MPIEHRDLVFEKYAEYLKQNAGKTGQKGGASKQQKQEYTKPPEGISPMKLGLHRIDSDSSVGLTKQVELETSQASFERIVRFIISLVSAFKQVLLPGGSFWFGSQSEVLGGKIISTKSKDGAEPRKLVEVK